VLVVRLNVCAELEDTMALVVDVLVKNKPAWAEHLGDTIARWKAIKPENATGHELSNHAWWDHCKRESCKDTATSFLDRAYVSLDLGHVFVFSTDVDSSSSWKVISKALELAVGTELSDLEQLVTV